MFVTLWFSRISLKDPKRSKKFSHYLTIPLTRSRITEGSKVRMTCKENARWTDLKPQRHSVTLDIKIAQEY